MHKALFLDRDGVINLDHGYVYKPKDFQFVEGIFALCRRFHQAGYLLVVVTNQSGIGRGYYSEADFKHLTEWMKQRFIEQQAPLAGVYYCPHHSESAQGKYKLACDCRKPEPGMLLQAAKDLNIDLSQSVMVGDKVSDMQAAERAGVKKRYFFAHPGTEGAPQGSVVIHKLTNIP